VAMVLWQATMQIHPAWYALRSLGYYKMVCLAIGKQDSLQPSHLPFLDYQILN
jgi:hypothetical protein